MIDRWIAGLRPASLLGLRLPNKLGVFASDTVGHWKFPGPDDMIGTNGRTSKIVNSQMIIWWEQMDAQIRM